MNDAARHPRVLELPRDDAGLATTRVAVRRLQELLPEFLRDLVTEADATGLVVPLDGGVDSAAAAAIAVDAVGAADVIAVTMPAGLADEATTRTAEAVAEMLGIEHRRLQLQPLVRAFQELLGESGGPADDLVATDNAVARFRTATTYYVANRRDALVVGPVNRTDRLLGSARKYGETGVDCFLFGDCYRTEVRALAEAMALPVEILDSGPGQGPEHSDDPDRLGAAPETVDRALRLHIDEGRDASAVADRLDIDCSVVTRLAEWCAATRHKRHQPPKPSTNR